MSDASKTNQTESRPPPSYVPLTIPSGIHSAARRAPDKVALVEGSKQITFATLWERSARLASALVGHASLRRGERVAIMSPNCLEFVEAVCGIGLAGGIAVLVNPRYTAEEAAYVCNDSDASFLFVHPGVEEIARTAPLASVERIVVFGNEYESWLSDGRVQVAYPRIAEWDPFALVYTSGTTGRPKGVLLSHRSRSLTFLAMAAEYGCYSSEDVSVVVAPLYHGGGLSFALAPLFVGGTCAILPSFEPERFLQTIETLSATNVFLVPTHFHKLFALGSRILRRYKLRSLKGVISNAAPLPQATKEQIIDYFGPEVLHETYGSTEASIVSNLRPQDQLRKRECVGLPFPATQIRILGRDGNEVEVGDAGELHSHSPYLFNGYWRQAELTARAFRDQWFTAGDLARQDEGGYLYIVGRTDDMIISGGVNIYPREIEEVLAQHPAVSDVAVVGLPHEYWGEAVTAFVVKRAGASGSTDDLVAFCGERLARFKLPKSFEYVPAIPRSEAGKILRGELRERCRGTREVRS